jgi:hypothetical protein
MSFLKFAFSEQVVIDHFSDDTQPKFDPNSPDSKAAAEQFSKTVRAAKRIIKKSTDFLYVRTRAIGSLEKWGPNMNGDGFPMKELTASYRSFVGKGNFIDHKSDDITKIRGLVIDAFLNKDDQCVECLIAVDKKSHPQLARDIETGVMHSVSMGTRVGWSECSVCGNNARTERDYCSHIANYKGMKVGFLTNDAKHKFGKFAVHEVNHDLEFIELSWVSVPAFQDAYVLEKIASLKTAVDNGQLTGNSNGMSDSEKEMWAAANIVANENSIPQSLRTIAEGAKCHDTECNFDPRVNRTSKPSGDMSMNKVAGEMNRVRITREEVGFRTVPKDYSAKGTVIVDTKEYRWWASSQDKKDWQVNLEDGIASLSAAGQSQIVRAIREMIEKSIDSTDLVVASAKFGLRSIGYLQGEEDPLMKKPLEELVEKGDRLYDPKSLEVATGGDGRDHETETYEETAKGGPSGALGKRLPAKDETIKSEELKLKEEFQRAYLKYKTLKKMGKVN